MLYIPREGDWFRSTCCDCNLTHDYVFAPDDKGGMYWQIIQNKRATAQRRRKDEADRPRNNRMEKEETTPSKIHAGFPRSERPLQNDP